MPTLETIEVLHEASPALLDSNRVEHPVEMDHDDDDGDDDDDDDDDMTVQVLSEQEEEIEDNEDPPSPTRDDPTTYHSSSPKPNGNDKPSRDETHRIVMSPQTRKKILDCELLDGATCGASSSSAVTMTDLSKTTKGNHKHVEAVESMDQDTKPRTRSKRATTQKRNISAQGSVQPVPLPRKRRATTTPTAANTAADAAEGVEKRKRHVTPTTEPSDKKVQQQKRSNQLTLGSFFFKPSHVSSPTLANRSNNTTQQAFKAPLSPKVQVPNDKETATEECDQPAVQQTDSTNMEIQGPSKKVVKGNENRQALEYSNEHEQHVPNAQDQEKAVDENQRPSDHQEELRAEATPVDASNHQNITQEEIMNGNEEIPSEETTAGTSNLEGSAEEETTSTDEVSVQEIHDNPAGSETKDCSNSNIAHASKEGITNGSVEKLEGEIRKAPTVLGINNENEAFESKVHVTEPALQPERQALRQKYEDLKLRYMDRGEEIMEAARTGIDEETFKMQELEESVIEDGSENDFPDSVVANMALLIEGRYVFDQFTWLLHQSWQSI